ncbi:MAG: amino acid ABC transporter permease [Eubacteriales bacterium]|nr:amino acid ABC transporter permease [Eubacteriales bacterium]
MSLPEGFLPRIFFILEEYWGSFMSGVGNTMLIAVVSTFIGCIIGFLVGMIQTIPTDKEENPVKFYFMLIVKFILNAYVEIFRGTPMMVQAMFIYYGSSMVFGIDLGMYQAAFLIVSINTGAYMAETVRGGILSIDPGQTEGAMAIGMNHWQTMMSVILPQALRNIMPQIGNNLIINIKDTCVLSVIGMMELFYTTKGIAGAYYTYFEAFSITMVLYFILTFTCSRILRYIEMRMDGPDNYELVMSDALTMGEGTYRMPNKEKDTNADLRAHKQSEASKNALNHGSQRGNL